MNEPSALFTTLLMLLTGIFSYLGFRNRAVEEKYIFHPTSILAGKEYYRLVTSAFLHADWGHLLFNMLSLYLFGRGVEMFVGSGHFLLIYFGAVVGGNVLSLYVWVHFYVVCLLKEKAAPPDFPNISDKKWRWTPSSTRSRKEE